MNLLLLFCIAFPTLIILLFALDYFYSLRAGKPLLKEWAMDNGYELLNVQYGLIRVNPFFFNFIWKKRLFRVTVKTREGNQRGAWILLGDALSGLRVKEFEIKWIT